MKHLFWVIPLTLVLTAFWTLLFRWIHHTFGLFAVFSVWVLLFSISVFALVLMVQDE